MTTLPLHFRKGHLFLESGNALWLIDTGAPASFGTTSSLTLAGEDFRIENSVPGLDAVTLSRFVGVDCAGLLGADVLGRMDLLLDVPRGTVTLSTAELPHSGQRIALEEFMGIPIVSARIRDAEYRMFFDTGAQISYFQDDSLSDFPSAGVITDFYPGVGEFQTETHSVDINIGGADFTLRCGALPGLLGTALMLSCTEGIVGNEILRNRQVGYFPRRRLLVL